MQMYRTFSQESKLDRLTYRHSHVLRGNMLYR